MKLFVFSFYLFFAIASVYCNQDLGDESHEYTQVCPYIVSIEASSTEVRAGTPVQLTCNLEDATQYTEVTWKVTSDWYDYEFSNEEGITTTFTPLEHSSLGFEVRCVVTESNCLDDYMDIVISTTSPITKLFVSTLDAETYEPIQSRVKLTNVTADNNTGYQWTQDDGIIEIDYQLEDSLIEIDAISNCYLYLQESVNATLEGEEMNIDIDLEKADITLDTLTLDVPFVMDQQTTYELTTSGLFVPDAMYFTFNWNDEWEDVRLYDDGSHSDAISNDGVFTNRLAIHHNTMPTLYFWIKTEEARFYRTILTHGLIAVDLNSEESVYDITGIWESYDNMNCGKKYD